MGVRSIGKTLAVMAVLSLFSGCGEMDMLFLRNESYQVTALVNGNSLDGCSIIRSDDKIRPYFAAPVENDPDLTGLLVYIQDSQGKVMGDQVLYTLKPYSTEDTSKPGDTARVSRQLANITAQLAGDFTGDLLPREKWSFINPIPEPQTPPTVVQVKSLDQKMPYFPLPEDMEIGLYKLVFEALGGNEALYRTESDIFFLGGVELSVKDISIYQSTASETQLIPPGATVMLESNLDFDSSLEPYIIWYDGKNVLSEGRINEGAGSILWKAPERAGFYSLRFEVFPFQIRGNLAGIFREIALPVSSRAVATSTGYFFGEGPEYAARTPLSMGTIFPEQGRPEAATPALLKWYQFEGSLYDTISMPSIDEPLLSASGNAPLWAATGQSYGLSTGPEDGYLLSPITFFRKDSDQGGGIFLFHIMSLAEGTVLSASFPQRYSSAEGATIDVVRKKHTITLHLETQETTVEMPLYLPAFELQTFIPAALEFYIHPDRLEAKLSVGNNAAGQRQPLASVVGNVRLPGALAGEARIRLGGNDLAAVSEETSRQETSANTIWNEFAILYSSLPIQKDAIEENIIIEEDKTVIADTATQVNRRVIQVEVTLEYRDNIDPENQMEPDTASGVSESEETGNSP